MIQNENKYHLPKGGVLEIKPLVLEQLESYRPSSTEQPKSGGLLLGRFIADEALPLIVDEITVPEPPDIQAMDHFIRKSPHHQQRVIDMWNVSNGRFNFMGSWVSDTAEKPSPDIFQLSQWKKENQASQDALGRSIHLMLGPETIRVWLYQNQRLWPLKPVPEAPPEPPKVKKDLIDLI